MCDNVDALLSGEEDGGEYDIKDEEEDALLLEEDDFEQDEPAERREDAENDVLELNMEDTLNDDDDGNDSNSPREKFISERIETDSKSVGIGKPPQQSGPASKENFSSNAGGNNNKTFFPKGRGNHRGAARGRGRQKKFLPPKQRPEGNKYFINPHFKGSVQITQNGSWNKKPILPVQPLNHPRPSNYQQMNQQYAPRQPYQVMQPHRMQPHRMHSPAPPPPPRVHYKPPVHERLGSHPPPVAPHFENIQVHFSAEQSAPQMMQPNVFPSQQYNAPPIHTPPFNQPQFQSPVFSTPPPMYNPPPPQQPSSYHHPMQYSPNVPPPEHMHQPPPPQPFVQQQVMFQQPPHYSTFEALPPQEHFPTFEPLPPQVNFGNPAEMNYDTNIRPLMSNYQPQQKYFRNNTDHRGAQRYGPQKVSPVKRRNWKCDDVESSKRLNLQEVPTVDTTAVKMEKPSTPIPEEDEETRLYRQKIEEQKRLREQVMARKEERRKIAAKKQMAEEEYQTVVGPREFLETTTIMTSNVGSTTSAATASGSVRCAQENKVEDIKNFLRDRKIINSDQSLIDTNVVVVTNIAAGTTEVKLRKLTQGVGIVQKIEMSPKERQATILFKSVASAHAFYKKYQRFMLDLSMIQVTLKPI